jgi:hypothetical protein
MGGDGAEGKNPRQGSETNKKKEEWRRGEDEGETEGIKWEKTLRCRGRGRERVRERER